MALCKTQDKYEPEEINNNMEESCKRDNSYATNQNNNTYDPGKGEAPEKKRGKSGLSNLKHIKSSNISSIK